MTKRQQDIIRFCCNEVVDNSTQRVYSDAEIDAARLAFDVFQAEAARREREHQATISVLESRLRIYRSGGG